MAQDRLTAYAEWLKANKDKPDTPEFKKVAEAYKSLRAMQTIKTSPESEGMPGERMQPTMYERARPYVSPVVETAAAIGGGLLGAPLGPPGAVGGAALGYGIGREAMEAADVFLGGKRPRTAIEAVTEPVQSVAYGGLMELGGPVVMKGIEKAAKGIAGGIDKISAVGSPQKTASRIARNALGEDLPAVLNALRQAPEGATAAQATADINSPVWQSLIDRALRRDPRFLSALEQSQGEVSLNALSRLAGGTTATEVRAAQEGAKKQVNEQLVPVLETEMAAANIAGTRLPALEAQAERFGQAASQKVEDVKRFQAAGERAIEKAKGKYPVPGMPRMPVKYTYEAELAKAADQVASDAAEASLRFGEARRFSQAAADSLAAHGLKPLKADDVVKGIDKTLQDPKLAGNKIIERSLRQVAKDIQKWTNEGGVIDAWALDAIRKNSVNSVIQQMTPAASRSEQKALAQGVISRIKPNIIKAIEDAGGTGYGQYLKDYSDEMAKIAQSKLTGKALELFKTNKDDFARLVQGESPEQVEKILGPGSYDIAKEVSDSTLAVLKEEASKVIRDAKIKSQVAGGQDALKELLEQNISKFRIPSYLNQVATTTNAALEALEKKIGQETMSKLTEAFKTTKGTQELIGLLPPSEQSRVLNLLAKPESWSARIAKELPGKGVGVAGTEAVNRLVEGYEPQNALRNK